MLCHARCTGHDGGERGRGRKCRWVREEGAEEGELAMGGREKQVRSRKEESSEDQRGRRRRRRKRRVEADLRGVEEDIS